MDSKILELVKCIAKYMINSNEANGEFSFTKIYNFAEKNSPDNIKVTISDVFNALCLPYESTLLFELTKSDIDDFYFKLKLSAQDTMNLIDSIEPVVQQQPQEVNYPTSPIAIPKFTDLMLDMENITRKKQILLSKNEMLAKEYNEAHVQHLSLSNPTTMKQQIKNCQELINRLTPNADGQNFPN